MAEIKCKSCLQKDCSSCNTYILEVANELGLFDEYLNDNKMFEFHNEINTTSYIMGYKDAIKDVMKKLGE